MNQKFRTTQIIHLALVAGLIFAYIIVGEITSFNKLKMPVINSTNIVYSLIPLIVLVVSNILFKFNLKQIDKKNKLEENHLEYQTALIIRYAIIEAGAFILLFVFPDFKLFGVLLIIYLVMLRPSVNQMKRDLDII